MTSDLFQRIDEFLNHIKEAETPTPANSAPVEQATDQTILQEPMQQEPVSTQPDSAATFNLETNKQLANLFEEPLASQIRNATKPVIGFNNGELVLQETTERNSTERFKEEGPELTMSIPGTPPAGSTKIDLSLLLKPSVNEYLTAKNLKISSIRIDPKTKTQYIKIGDGEFTSEQLEKTAEEYKTQDAAAIEEAKKFSADLASLLNDKNAPLIASFNKGKILSIQEDGSIQYNVKPGEELATEETFKLEGTVAGNFNGIFKKEIADCLAENNMIVTSIEPDQEKKAIIFKVGDNSYNIEAFKQMIQNAKNEAEKKQPDNFKTVNTLTKEEVDRARPTLIKEMNDFIKSRIDDFKGQYEGIKGPLAGDLTYSIQDGGLREIKESNSILLKVQRFLEAEPTEEKKPEEKPERISQEILLKIILSGKPAPVEEGQGIEKEDNKKKLEEFKNFLLKIRNDYIASKENKPLVEWKDDKVILSGVPAEVKISVGAGADKNTFVKETETGLEGNISFILSKDLAERKGAAIFNKIGNVAGKILGSAANIAGTAVGAIAPSHSVGTVQA